MGHESLYVSCRAQTSFVSFVVEGFGVGPAKGQELFVIVDARRSKSCISDKDVTHFQAFAEMRRWSLSFCQSAHISLISSEYASGVQVKIPLVSDPKAKSQQPRADH